MRMSDGKYEQTTPAMEWSFTVPDNRTSVELVGVYTADLRTLIPHDSYELVDGVMKIYFSASTGSVTGVVRYEYDIDGSTGSPSTVTGTGGMITVIQNNYPKA